MKAGTLRLQVESDSIVRVTYTLPRSPARDAAVHGYQAKLAGGAVGYAIKR